MRENNAVSLRRRAKPEEVSSSNRKSYFSIRRVPHTFIRTRHTAHVTFSRSRFQEIAA